MTVTKTSTDINVLNNTIVNPNLNDGTHTGAEGCFIEVGGTTTNAITLKNNLYVAPNLNTAAFTAAAAVRVISRNDLNNFVNGGIANNDWPDPSNANSRGVNYVSDGSLAGTAAYYTPAEWNAMTGKVSGDTFEALKITDLSSTLAPPSTSLAAINGLPVAGVFTDLYGILRTTTDWSDGGVQI